MAAWTYNTEQIPITGDGSSLYLAAKQVNTYFNRLSAEWFSFVYQYNDARASEVISVSYDDLETGVYNYLSAANYTYTGQNLSTLILDKLHQLPDHLQRLMYHTYHAPDLYQQKAGLLDTPRVLYYDGTTGMWRFANNKNLTDGYADFTGVIGNVYPAERRVELVLNGVIYNYSEQPFIPGEVYYLTDLLDGWMVPYQEGGEGRIISVPMAVATGRNSAILLSSRGITKDLPCEKICPPVSLNWRESQLVYRAVFEPDCDNVVLHLPSNLTSNDQEIHDRSKYDHDMTHDESIITHSADHAKYGTSSIKFIGEENAMVTTSPGDKMNLDANDFCIEFWVLFEDQMRHDFIMGLYDESNRRRSWHIESPDSTSGLGSGMVFTVNNGVESDDFKIRLGFDYEFENNTWYHVALSRQGNTWRWLVNGLEQETRLTSGLLNTTIPSFNNPQFRMGAPGQSTHTNNISSVVLDGLKIDEGEVIDSSIDDIYSLILSQDLSYISTIKTCDTHPCGLNLDMTNDMLDVSQAAPLTNGEFYGSTGDHDLFDRKSGTPAVTHDSANNTYNFLVKHVNALAGWSQTHYVYSMFDDNITIDSDAGSICLSYELEYTSNIIVSPGLMIKQNDNYYVKFFTSAVNASRAEQNMKLDPSSFRRFGATTTDDIQLDRGSSFSVGVTFGQTYGSYTNTVTTLRKLKVCIGSPDYEKADNTCTVYLSSPVDSVDFTILRTRDVPASTYMSINLLDQHDNWIQAVSYKPDSIDPRIMTQTRALTSSQQVHAVQWALTGTDFLAETQLLQFKSGSMIREWAEFRTARTTRTVPLLGYLDDVRITNGSSVYTGNFKPSGTPHPLCT